MLRPINRDIEDVSAQLILTVSNPVQDVALQEECNNTSTGPAAILISMFIARSGE